MGYQKALCDVKELQFGAKVYIYFEVDENGDPDYNTLDSQDATEAAQEAVDAEYYYCRGCGNEWKTKEEALDHLTQSQERIK